MTLPAPILGIVSEQDNPHENWIAVLYAKPGPEKLFWRYVAPRVDGNAEHECTYPEDFRPLADFNVVFHMTNDARLGIHHLADRLPAARYSNGRARYWQGATTCILDISHRAGGYVLRAVQTEFESRRVQVAS